MVEGDEDYAAICAVPADHPNLTCVGRPDPSFFLQAQCVHFETHEHVKTLNRLGGAAVGDSVTSMGGSRATRGQWRRA